VPKSRTPHAFNFAPPPPCVRFRHTCLTPLRLRAGDAFMKQDFFEEKSVFLKVKNVKFFACSERYKEF